MGSPLRGQGGPTLDQSIDLPFPPLPPACRCRAFLFPGSLVSGTVCLAMSSVYTQRSEIGVGEAIRRLIAIEHALRLGCDAPETRQLRLEEREMITAALDEYQLQLQLTCDEGTELPTDEGAIFEYSVRTSCCRLFSADTSRREPDPPKRRTRKSSRRS